MNKLLISGYGYFKRFGFFGTIGRYLLLKQNSKQFIHQASTSNEKKSRKDLVRRFFQIQKQIDCVHSPFQFIEMASYLLPLKIEGPIVECGCANGGSSAKLSLLAKATHRKLYVCDSFKGIPFLEDGKTRETYRGHSSMPDSVAYEGKFATALGEVKKNVEQHGCLDVCEFIPGYYEQTLPLLDISPVVVYTDTALIRSTLTCLKSLWPKLKPGGYWFTHEASYLEYVQGVFDPEWWRNTFNEPPPLVFGAGSGLSVLSPSLAYFKKPSATD